MAWKAVFCFFSSLLVLFSGEVAAERLSLSDGLKIVAEKSRLIKISREDEKIADADRQAAFSRLLPSISASAAWTASAYQPAALFGLQTVAVAERNFFSYSFSVQQTLFDFQKKASLYDASIVALSAKRFESQRTRNLAAIEFVLTYLDVLEAEKLISTSEKEVEALEAHVRKAQSLFEEGVITKNDLLQARVMISDARQRLLIMSTLKRLQASRLNSILLRPLKAEVSLQDIGEQPDAGVPSVSVEAAWGLAEQQRAELRIADETLRALGFEKTAKRAEYFPELFVKGGYDYTENRFQLHEGNWSVTFGLSMNLFSGGLTGSEIRKLEFQRQKLAEQRAKLLEDIYLEVEQYLLQSISARERLHVTGDSIQQAEENLRISRVKYEEGIGTGADVLDAVALLASARTNYFKALYDLRKFEAALYYAMGKDLLEVYQ